MTRRLMGFLAVIGFGLIGPGLSPPVQAQGMPLELFSLLTAASPPSYTITDLGNLGGSYSFPNGINNAGQVAATSYAADDTPLHVFLIGGAMATDVGTLGGPNSLGSAINTAGQVAGTSSLTDGQTYHAFLWTKGVMQDLGALGNYSQAYGINDAGQVCGWNDLFYADPNRGHAFLWTKGAMKDLGSLAPAGSLYDFSEATAVNAAGEVAGDALTGDIGPGGILINHAFLWANGAMKDLGTLGGLLSAAHAINVSGQIVGTSWLAGDPDNHANHACLWANGAVTDLGSFGGNSIAWDINAAGQIVGISGLPAGQDGSHAFLWSGGIMRDLNQSLPAGSGWVLTNALAINDAGQIVGHGTFNGQDRRTFLLSPQ